MAAQSYRPLKWVIVSDGSTDGTDDLVRKYAADNPWIDLLRMPERTERHFAGKVHAFKAGYDKAKDLNPDVVGNLDADVSIEPDHFQYLLSKFAENPDLGVGGSPFKEGSRQYDYRFSNIENVWGGCQLFRRECYEAIGGYTPVKGGGIDHIAVVSARMKGWKTRTFTDKVCIHHRGMGTAQQGALKATFRQGSQGLLFGKPSALGIIPDVVSDEELASLRRRPGLGSRLFLVHGAESGSLGIQRRGCFYPSRTDAAAEEVGHQVLKIFFWPQLRSARKPLMGSWWQASGRLLRAFRSEAKVSRLHRYGQI